MKDAKNIYARYQRNPDAFMIEVLGVPEEHLWEKPLEIMNAVRDNPKVAVRAGHGVSKTWVLARIVIWFLYCFRPATVVTTAPTGKQVKDLLWREIREAHANAIIPLGGDVTTTKIDLQKEKFGVAGNKKQVIWFATGFSTKPDTVTQEATAFQGYHNVHLLEVFDEAAGIMPEIWRAGQYIGAPHKRWVAIGNATSRSGDFAACFKDKTWHKIAVSVLDTPNFKQRKTVIPGLYGRQFEEDIRLKYGVESDEYAVRVKGEISQKAVEGSYYGRTIKAMYEGGRIGWFPHDPHYAVHIAWDPGYTTALWLFQVIEGNVGLVRYYEDQGPDVKDYVRLLIEWKESEGYVYGKHFVPCDMDGKGQLIVTGQTALEVLRDLQQNVVALKREVRVIEGIARTKKMLARTRIHKTEDDSPDCKLGIDRVECYHEAKNMRMSTEDKPVFTGVPEKDGNDHGADALRYVSLAVKTQDMGNAMTAQESRDLWAQHRR